MKKYILRGVNFDCEIKCKSFKESQEKLEWAYKFFSADSFWDVVRLEYFPEGHKYAGKIQGLFYAYGCRGLRVRLEIIS